MQDLDVLKRVMSVDDPNGRLARWRLAFSTFDFTVFYRPGLKDQVPDTLSQIVVEKAVMSKELEDDMPTLGGVDVSSTRASAKRIKRRKDKEVEASGDEAETRDALDELRAVAPTKTVSLQSPANMQDILNA